MIYTDENLPKPVKILSHKFNRKLFPSSKSSMCHVGDAEGYVNNNNEFYPVK